MNLKDNIDSTKVPSHVAIIMDGNGRWAKNHGEERIFGHANGVEGVREALTGATEAGVKYLTLYAFSTENWDRPKEEVDALMNLLVDTILKEINSLNENQIRLQAIGDLNMLPSECKESLLNAIDHTKKNSRLTLVLALSYSSRWEIIEMVKNIAKNVKNNNLEIDQINSETISNYLVTKGIPDPELLIRTSGEKRVSNFLLWQIAYTELYFTETLWPDFKKEDLFKAIIEYQNRERRFGKISEQIKV
jgi:undecaprenyl diphosphate synthase